MQSISSNVVVFKTLYYCIIINIIIIIIIIIYETESTVQEGLDIFFVYTTKVLIGRIKGMKRKKRNGKRRGKQQMWHKSF